jgi:hypothetical protein
MNHLHGNAELFFVGTLREKYDALGEEIFALRLCNEKRQNEKETIRTQN